MRTTLIVVFCTLGVLKSQAQLNFTNIAGSGIDESDIPYSKDGGCSFADYDLDGDLDLLVNTSDNTATRRSYLLRNDNGVFTDVTTTVAPGLKDTEDTERSAAWGDCNGDGYPDLMVNSFFRFKLLINNAGTSFSVHTNTNTMTDGMNTEGLGWLDYDNDGDLDYFIENDSFGIDIFENDGSTPTPVFTQVTLNSVGAAGTGSGGLGLPEGGSTDGDFATSVDLNNDGYVDIIARRRNNGANDGQDRNPYDIFINDGDGTYTPLTTFNERGNNADKGAILAGDFDNDGDFDIIWTSGTTDSDLAILYENMGTVPMTFTPVPNPFTFDNGAAFNITDTEGAAMGDIDHDGDIDVFMTRLGGGTSYLFLNNSTGPGNFAFRQPGPTSIPGSAINYGINVAANGQGCVFADYDNDGDVDLYVNRNGSTNQLWQNDYVGSATETAAIYQNNYLRVIPMVDLGGGVHRPALNATVTFLDCDGVPIGGIREIGSGGAGHGSQTSPWLIFGLPDGPDASYIIEVQFTRDGTTPVVVQRSVVPSQLPDLNLGTSSLLLEQTLIVRDTEGSESFYCQDTDGDGINDFADLDNDNDGIPDSEEGCSNLIVNSSFELQDFSDAVVFPGGFSEPAGTFIGASYNSNTLTGWDYTTNLDGWVGNQSPGWSANSFNAAKDGSQYLDVTGNNNVTGGVNNTLSQTIPTTIGDSYSLSFYWGEDVGHAVGQLVTLDVWVEDASSTSILTDNLVTVASGPAGGFMGPKNWLYYTAHFTATSTTSTVFFHATPPSGSTAAGAALDLVKVISNNCADSDGDGIDDYLDLDSDNDGIFDLVESGHGEDDLDGDGVIDGADTGSGDNGLFDGVEDAPDSGILDYVIGDTDGDGLLDAAEIDSDGDGCLDAIEAGFTDSNDDGEADGTGYASDGTVTGSDGYNGTDPIVTDFNHVALACDTDGDGVNPTVDLDDDNDGIPDVNERDCSSRVPFDLSSITPMSTELVDNPITSSPFSGTFSSDVTAAHTSTLTTRPVGTAVGDLRFGNNASSERSEYRFVFDSPTSIILSQAELSGAFEQLERWKVTSTGGVLQFYNPVVNVTTSNSTNWNQRELVILSGNNTNEAEFRSRLANSDGNISVADSEWSLTADDVTELTLNFRMTNNITNVTRIKVSSTCEALDTDSDGVPDHLDLDSDNDGIFDLVESGHGEDDLDGDGVIDGADTGSGDNGLFDGVEDAPDSGILDQPTADSDGDGNIDATELDSDNDGCNDIIEAGYSDPDNDGVLGND